MFLLVDLQVFFRFKVGGMVKKCSENDQLTSHFQSFSFNISRTIRKTNKVNQQSLIKFLNISSFSLQSG